MIARVASLFVLRCNVCSSSVQHAEFVLQRGLSLLEGPPFSHGFASERIANSLVDTPTWLEVIDAILFDRCCKSHEDCLILHLPINPERLFREHANQVKREQNSTETTEELKKKEKNSMSQWRPMTVKTRKTNVVTSSTLKGGLGTPTRSNTSFPT